MVQGKITKAKIKRIMDDIPVVTKKLYPAGGINEILDMSYKDCNIEERWIEFRVNVGEKAANRLGAVHGGYLSGILDDAMGRTLYCMRSDHSINGVTLDMRFNCMRPIFVGDKLVLRAQIEHIGKTTAITTAALFRGKEKCAIATESWSMIKLYLDEFEGCGESK